MAMLLFAFSFNEARADCPAAPIAHPDDLVVSFLVANGVQAASASLLPSTVKEGMLVYDDTNDALKLCNGTAWQTINVGASGATPAGTIAGAVQFRGATAVLAADDANLVWDNTNKRLGIGTATPTVPLEVVGDLKSTSLTINGLSAITRSGGFMRLNATAGNEGVALFPGSSGTAVLAIPNSTANVGIGTTSPAASALLDVSSTSKGFLPPRMTTAQRDAIASPATGLMLFNTTAAQYQFWTGTAWSGLGSGAVPTGTIAAFALASCPLGWTEYTAARGRFLRGIDNGAGNDPAGTRAPGNTQADEIKSHLHDVNPPSTATNSAGAHAHDYNRPNITASYRNNLESGSNGNQTVTAGASTSTDGAHTHTVDIAAFDSASTGGVETRPKNVAVLFCQYSGSGGGGGGATTLADLTDVDVSAAANGKVLTYNSTTSKWDAETPSGGTPASPVNSVQFNNAGAFGGDAALTWDNTNKRLGIGTASPRGNLHIHDPGQFATLTMSAAGGSNKNLYIHYGENTTQGNQLRFGRLTSAGAWEANPILFDMDAPDLSLILNGSGNLGIGTTAPGRLLQVGNTDGIAQIGNMFSATISGDDAGHGVFGSNLYVDSTGALKTTGTHPSYGYSGMHSTWGALKFYTATGATNADAVGAPPAKMTKEKAGHGGIGTSTPGYKLVVSGDAAASWLNAAIAIGDSGAGGRAYSIGSRNGVGFHIGDESAGASRLVINSSGNVGIGTANPLVKLDVAGVIRTNNAGFVADGSAGTDERLLWLGSSGINRFALGLSNVAETGSASGSNFVIHRYNDAGAWQDSAFTILRSNGNVGVGLTNPSYKLQSAGQVAGAGAYVNTSDARLKKDVVELNDGLKTVMRLRPVSFFWKSQLAAWQRGRKLGLIAQEVEPIVPEIVSTGDDAMHTKSIAYGDLMPVLIKAIQELKAANDNQAEQINGLREDINALKAAR